ncbi:MAG: hypothetical protein R3C05_09835 [Pirellulaceae bacterium]
MNRIIVNTEWLAPFFVLVLGCPAFAEPNEDGTATTYSKPSVLLTNDQVLEGSARQEGDRVVIEQSDGAVIRLPIDRVLCWGPDRKSLYQYRVDQRKRPTVQDHLAEARWCLNNGLYSEAAKELLNVRRLSPENEEADQVEQQLRKATLPVQTVSAEAVAPPETVPDRAYVSAFATQQFTRVIQPILINRCGSCHDNGSTTKFTLMRLPGVSRVSSSMTHRNLQHVVEWIDTDEPLKSPLLQYAQSGHGGSDQAPLGKSQTRAFESLALWCSLFAKSSVEGLSMTQPTSTTNAISPFKQQGNEQSLSPPTHVVSANTSETDHLNDATPRRLPEVPDPFDPEVFNRKHHPGSSLR